MFIFMLLLTCYFYIYKVTTSSEKSNGFHPYAALGVGIAAGIVYIACSSLLKHFKFDDVVDSVAGNLMHLYFIDRCLLI